MQEGRDPRVVIVGGGFGGLWAAEALARKPVEVLLVDRNNFHVFWPLLYQVSAAEIEGTQIAYPIRSVLQKHPNLQFRMAEVGELDAEGKVIRAGEQTIAYDVLVLAMGSVPHFLGIPGADAHCFPLKGLDDGLELRNRILSRFELASAEPDPDARRRLLRFVIVGAGTTGVEIAGAIAELVRALLRREYRELGPDAATVILVEALDAVLTEFASDLGAYARERLERMGVDVRLGTKVEEVTSTGVRFAGGDRIHSDTVIWSAGVRGHPLAEKWGLPTTPKGTVEVEPTLQVRGVPNVFVIGDLAFLEQDGAPLPMIAPVATQQAKVVAENTIHQLRGEPLESFRYKDPGRLATIGRNKAVAQVRGRSFTGFPAWALWAGVHLFELVGIRNRIVVLISWMQDYMFSKRAIRLVLPLHEVEDVTEAEDPSETQPVPFPRAGRPRPRRARRPRSQI